MNWVGWAKLIGGGAAAPFTGGATLPIAMSGLADVTGNAAKGSMEEDSKNSQLKMLLENAKLNRDKFALMAPGQRLQTSEVSNLLSNYKPSQMNWGPGGFTPGAGARGVQPTITGGPSAAFANPSPQAAQMRQQVADDELLAQMQGGGTGPGRGGDTNMSNLKDVGNTSTGSKILGGVSLGSGILAQLLAAKGGLGANSGTSDVSSGIYS